MSQYIDRKTAAKSYRPKAGTMSPGLKRAREPYRIRNAITGIALGALAAGVWAYSISAVKQDVFDDVDEEVRALGAAGPASTVSVSIINKDVEGEKDMAANVTAGLTVPSPVQLRAQTTEVPTIGVLQRLHGRFPKLLDPETKSFVWGAPPVDNIGKMWKS